MFDFLFIKIIRVLTPYINNLVIVSDKPSDYEGMNHILYSNNRVKNVILCNTIQSYSEFSHAIQVDVLLVDIKLYRGFLNSNLKEFSQLFYLEDGVVGILANSLFEEGVEYLLEHHKLDVFLRPFSIFALKNLISKLDYVRGC